MARAIAHGTELRCGPSQFTLLCPCGPEGARNEALLEGRGWRLIWRGKLRGRVVFDKSFVIMALACAMAPIVGAGLYLVVLLF
jgi:hypothetical protein